MVVEYEFIARYDSAKVTAAALKADVAAKTGVAEDKLSVSGSKQLSASLMVGFVTLMMVL